jgi:hypothetical protein
VGLQVLANHFNETTMFRVADASKSIKTCGLVALL